MDIANAEPSSGSVPEPNSSSMINEFSSALLIISITLCICAENVDRFCSILWLSPISTRMLLNTDIWLLSDTGIIRPHIVIAVRSPTVFKATVLPPVFGPVIIRQV